MKKLHIGLVISVIFLSFSGFHSAYADGLKHGTCSMTIDSVKNTWGHFAEATSICHGFEQGYYVPQQNTFHIMGIATYPVTHDVQQFKFTMPSGDYIDATITVHIVKEKPKSSSTSGSNTTSTKSSSTSGSKTTSTKTSSTPKTTKPKAPTVTKTKAPTTIKPKTSSEPTTPKKTTSTKTSSTSGSRKTSTKTSSTSKKNQSTNTKVVTKSTDKKTTQSPGNKKQTQKKTVKSKKSDPTTSKKQVDQATQKSKKGQSIKKESIGKINKKDKTKAQMVSGGQLWGIVGSVLLLLAIGASVYYLIRKRKTA